MAQEFQYIQDILKEFYAPAIVNQVYKKAPFWAQVEKKQKSAYGKRIVIPVQTAFSESVGSRTANTYTLPTAGRSTYDQAYIYMKRVYGRIQVDGFSIESASGKGGWVDIVSAETKGVANAFAIEMDRQSLGRGTSVIGHIASVSGSDLVVDNPAGITGDTPAAKWFRAGMVLDVWDTTGGATKLVDSLTISSISGSTLTMSASTGISTCADGDYVVREDSYSATPADVGDMMGLDGIIDSSNTPGSDFQGISRSVEETWGAHESSTSQVISETVIQNELDAIEQRTDGEPVNLLLTTYALRNKLVDIIRQDRVVDTMDMKAGWKAIKYVGGSSEIPIMVHKNLPVGYMYFISLPHIAFYTLKGMTWDNKGGGILKPVAGYDAYEAWFKIYANLGVDCCNAHGKLTALTTA